MLKTISFTVHGSPMGKPRMTQRDKWAKRKCVVRYYEYADKMRKVLRDANITLPEQHKVVDLSWTAYFEVPESKAKIAKTMIGSIHRSKPDRDNIDKAVLDISYPTGDSGIGCGTLRKFWSDESRIEITITYDESLEP